MQTRFALSVLATMVLAVTACDQSVPTAPDTNEVAPLFHVGAAARDLGDLGSQGWVCVNVPGLGVHCFPPGAFAAPASLPILVFDSDDPTDADAPFLGTELLIRADLYAGQPCPAEGGQYALMLAADTGLPADYRACHHYAHDD